MDFDTILKDPKYQAEFDKRIAKAIETAKGKWDEEAEAARKEMEENAKLTAEEKIKKQMEKLTQENEVYKANEAKRAMKDASLEYIKTKGYSNAIADLVDLSSFKDENDMHSRLDSINTTYSNTVSKAIDEKLKENGYADLTSNKGDGKKDDLFNFNFTPVKEVSK